MCSIQIAPTTIHPVMDKAAAYFGLRVIHVPVDSDLRADVEAMEKVNIDEFILEYQSQVPRRKCQSL